MYSFILLATAKVCASMFREGGGGFKVIWWERDVFCLTRSLADVSRHVLADVPVPLGQCGCHSAVSGHFLRHHPNAPWDAAWSNHHSHHRWVLCSFPLLYCRYYKCLKQHQNEKQMFILCHLSVCHRPLSTVGAVASWVWLLMCLIRLSKARRK